MFKLLKNKNLEIYLDLHHMIAWLYFSFRSSIYLFLFYFFSGLSGWTVCTPKAYDLISTFSIFMEVSNILLRELNTKKVLGQ